MSTMVERMARAMCAADSFPKGSVGFDIHWQEFGDGYTANALAALRELREPNDAMSDAAYKATASDAAFTAAIDAAIAEHLRSA